MKNLKKLIGVSLAVVLCLGLATTGVLADTSDTGTGTATLSDINEILATDDAISFTITAVTNSNAIDHGDANVLTFSTEHSNTPVFWKGEVTGVTKPGDAVVSDNTCEGYIYWAQAQTDNVYPVYINVDADGAEGCTISTAWASSNSTVPAGTGSKQAEFTVSYHLDDASSGDSVSTATYRVVFTTASTVYVKEGNSDWDFSSVSPDLSANCTELKVSTGDGEKNFLNGSDVELIGDSGATYVLTTLDTTGGSEQVLFQLGQKFAYTGSADQTDDFYALVDMPDLAAAGTYTWTITLTTVKWDDNN